MNVDKMQAGPELDQLIAKEVMGWKSVQYPGVIYWDEGEQGPIPGGRFSPRFSGSFRPSLEISAAWEVVETFVRRDWVVMVSFVQGAWFCNLPGFSAWGPTAPLVICRAALKARRQEADST